MPSVPQQQLQLDSDQLAEQLNHMLSIDSVRLWASKGKNVLDFGNQGDSPKMDECSQKRLVEVLTID